MSPEIFKTKFKELVLARGSVSEKGKTVVVQLKKEGGEKRKR